VDIIQSFAFLDFRGEIVMRDPDEKFIILEDWVARSAALGITEPARIYLGRAVGVGARDLIVRYNLKTRDYISTTSMDSELALLTANLALADAGKLFYDPFVGTGSFPVACGHFGAVAFGSDIDGRSFRGEGGKKSLKGNFEQYGIRSRLGDVFTADLINSPVHVPSETRLFDGIVCDPPYGVREGLRVLGCRNPEKRPWVVDAGMNRQKLVLARLRHLASR
jgi:tRNA (guanine10-N2)-methyltransferase